MVLSLTKLSAILILPLFIIPGVIGLKAKLYIVRRSDNYGRLDTIVYSWTIAMISLLIIYCGIHLLTGYFELVPPVLKTDNGGWDLEIILLFYFFHVIFSAIIGVLYGVFAYNLIEPRRVTERKSNKQLLFDTLIPKAEVEIWTDEGVSVRGTVLSRLIDDEYENIILSSPSRIYRDTRGEITRTEDLGEYHYINTSQIIEVAIHDEPILEQIADAERNDRLQQTITAIKEKHNEFSWTDFSTIDPITKPTIIFFTATTLVISLIIGIPSIGNSLLVQSIWIIFGYIIAPTAVARLIGKIEPTLQQAKLWAGAMSVPILGGVLFTIKSVSIFHFLPMSWVGSWVPFSMGGLFISYAVIMAIEKHRINTGIYLGILVPLLILFDITNITNSSINVPLVQLPVIGIIIVILLLFWEATRGPPSRRLNPHTIGNPTLTGSCIYFGYLLLAVPILLGRSPSILAVKQIPRLLSTLLIGTLSLYLWWNHKQDIESEEESEDRELVEELSQ